MSIEITVSGILEIGLPAEDDVVVPEVPWDRDIRDELARGTEFANSYLTADNGWWPRTLDQIDGVTIHHTMSNSPHATAVYYIKKDGGRPSLPYTIWVTETGEVLLCVDFKEGLWHDHTGHKNVHLSIGMAGLLHVHKPSLQQLEATAKVCVWAINSDVLPAITAIKQIKGHMDYTNTACPGWMSEASGYWRDEFYTILARIAIGDE